MPINPAFHRWPGEATVIGRLVVAFGELELEVASLAGKVLDKQYQILRAIYRLGMTSARIDMAFELMRDTLRYNGLTQEYEEAIKAVGFCLTIRNTYAHCHWADHQEAGLFYTNLQEAAKRSEGFDYAWRHIDVPLLLTQEEYFTYALEILRYLGHEQALRRGVLKIHVWPRPQALTPPTLHNPGDQHVPPWLSKAEKELHLARARAAQGGAPTPTRAQLDLEAKRAAKRAWEQAARDRSAAARSKKDRES
jgi:hypothetical protein